MIGEGGISYNSSFCAAAHARLGPSANPSLRYGFANRRNVKRKRAPTSKARPAAVLAAKSISKTICPISVTYWIFPAANGLCGIPSTMTEIVRCFFADPQLTGQVGPNFGVKSDGDEIDCQFPYRDRRRYARLSQPMPSLLFGQAIRRQAGTGRSAVDRGAVSLLSPTCRCCVALDGNTGVQLAV